MHSHEPGTGKSNNYAYLIADEPTRDAVVIDPANPPEYVMLYYSRQASN